jgi:hypothetical protein
MTPGDGVAFRQVFLNPATDGERGFIAFARASDAPS